ncbi:MAG: efflux transporter outer membrane subunit [Piscinibacter sp.]|nr:efflux transporter outer membrane subunit [Piscinibacter sp.]
MKRPTLIAVAAAALLAACASPGPQPPDRARLEPAALGATGTATPWPAERWWTGWHDDQLDALIERALAGQPSLQTAEARVRQARAAADAAGAARQPQLGVSVDLTDQRFSANGLYPPPLAGSTDWSADARVTGSWELDLFGRQRAALDAAIGGWRAAQADAQAARVLLAGNVAIGYFDLARLLENRRLADEALQQRRQILALVQQRVGAGLDTRVDLKQAEGLVAQTQVELDTLDGQVGRARHALAELSGQGPRALDALVPALASVRSAALPAQLPADLVGRRADLVAQRWRVDAATQEVGVARAAFYPNVNLVAFVGLSSLGLDRFIEAGARTYGLGPALRLPLFDGGRLRAQLGARHAEADAAVDAYNGALLRALREVADEVTTLQVLERQQQAQADATAAADAAADLALQRYRAGLGNFLTVLTAQTNVLTQRRAAADLKGRHLLAEAALARALGGGWHDA